MRALGLDLGTKTMGIAITDSNKKIASGIENFSYAKNDLMACINHIKKLFVNYPDIDTIVLGYPLYPSGDKSPNCLLVDKAKALIEQYIQNVKVVLEDERYTTLEATGMMKDLGLKASQIKKIKDKMSAVVILNS
ncbi:MAG: Holliday junction resolvase RuvX [Mycoplasmoidaceae bacterium]|nr:Holliday junction resolvase RuvX [Mycoplasmoidaceae bacterium]